MKGAEKMEEPQKVMRVIVDSEMIRLNHIQEAARFDPELAAAANGRLNDLGGMYGMVLDRWALRVLKNCRSSQPVSTT